jgi:tRNA(Ile)-lysidine synthase
MRVEKGLIYLMTWTADLPGMDFPQLQPDFTADLPIQGELEVGNGWYIQCDRIDHSEITLADALENSDPNQAWLDLAKLKLPLRVGRARRGQRFQPHGMLSGSQKLSDFWINIKHPRQARADWPVVYSGEKIAWLPGFRPAQPYLLSLETSQVLHLRLIRRSSTGE